ncbi:DUF262 domain-containing protein [Flavobacterium sp.]|uniref:DUF262 domain-containing protein n=1 Tax=Flavobacterium sp. TaxID=239 RepID=UPI00260D004D|nr:DUF262 domain-containing protein [Flavobacterium sp.]
MDISPDKQNIDRVFSNTTYYIDFYQRQYKWNEIPVKRLLEDVFYKFNEEYLKHKDSDIPLDQLIAKYSWYYLNTYVTNTVDGKIFIVDGQQRLTTITLILIKLKHLAESNNSKLTDWVKNKITGHSGFNREFWMNHELHKAALQGLLDGISLDKIDSSSGITAQNMLTNYQIISKWLDAEFSGKEHKLESFIFFFLNRLVLINLSVEQTEVPMVFEVINDRGVKLKPYEILKGKLLGQIDKDELLNLKLNEIWEDQVKKLNDFREDEIDEFFTYFLKSKLADTRGLAQKFDKDYHRVMFEDEYDRVLQLKHNPKGVKKFILNDFIYYTNLYAKIYSYAIEFDENQPYVFYNNLTEMNTQFLLILSACNINDEEEEQKIVTISRQLDRMFCLLQLQRSYNSNTFATEINKLSAEIRNQPLLVINQVFDKYLMQQLSDVRGVTVDNILNYAFFKETGIELDKRFKRYFFSRIEKFIADNTKMNMKHTFYDLIQNTGWKNGFHVEHILSYNTENKALFDNDEELFERERNRLGGLLLLKGLDNISSNNETYKKKLKSYANTLYWNETLREDTYKSKLDFKKMINDYDLNFRFMDQFGKEELEERHKLLFDLIKIIWK